MYLDDSFNFGLPTLTNSNTRTVSPNVFDAGAAKKLFGAGSKPARVIFKIPVTADASGGARVELVGADNAALTTNPEILGDSGNIITTPDGTAIGASGTVEGSFPVKQQVIAKRYYGLFLTLAGTNPDSVEASNTGRVVLDAMTSHFANEA